MLDNDGDDAWRPELSGSLFRTVQERRVFDDAKTFVDAVPGEDPALIEERFEERSSAPGFDLRAFVDRHFHVPDPVRADVELSADGRMDRYVDRLWSHLTRTFDAAAGSGGLPHVDPSDAAATSPPDADPPTADPPHTDPSTADPPTADPPHTDPSTADPPTADPPHAEANGKPRGTSIPLPNSHVVPGGRFREMYYWDSYFVAEGLAASDRVDAVADMAGNFASLVDRFGFVPTGNRTYYTSRSQPPLFYRLLRVLERERGWNAIESYVPRLEREYEFWTAGADRLSEGGCSEAGEGDAADPNSAENDASAEDDATAHRRVVRTPDGAVLNRYWDDRAGPRPEAYHHDRELAASDSVDDAATLYRNVRAACESGWDFSSRWLRDPDDLATVRTTELVPVDLNALLYGMESSLAEWLDAAGEPDRARAYARAAVERREAVEAHCWHPDEAFYVDYCWTDDGPADRLTLAGVVPLFTGLATEARAASVADRLRELFLVDGGLQTTLHESGEQWDRPNGWAPLHWLAVVGLHRYGHHELAAEVTERWLHVNRLVFDRTGRMAEKYDVCDLDRSIGHGEYDLQYGFGWTNGVVAALRRLRSAGVDEVI